MNFDEARAEYNRLRQGYDNRQLSPDDFARQVQALQVRDDSGTYWAIDGATGNWLRYDGQSWVPGQPPVAQHYTPPPTPTPSYGQGQTVVAGTTPQPGGYQPAGSGYAPAGGYGPQPGGYAGAAPAPAAAAAAAGARSRSKAKPIIFGCLGAVVVIALVCLGLGIAFRGAIGTALDTTSGLTDVVVAGNIDANNKPLDTATEFAPGHEVYVTYTFKRMQAGQKVHFRVTHDGKPVELSASSSTFTASEAATYNGVFKFMPGGTGSYTVDLLIDDATTPDKTVSFTVR